MPLIPLPCPSRATRQRRSNHGKGEGEGGGEAGGKEASDVLSATRPVQKAADQRRQRRPLPCCSSPWLNKRPLALGRLSGRKDASQRVRRTEAELQRDADLATGLGNALGDRPRFFCLQWPLSFACSFCSKQAEQGSKTLCFSMQCLLLEKREQDLVFFNTRSL